MKNWRGVVRQVVAGIADEALQRRAWFGVGPEVSSPDEDFNQFFGDAAVADFLHRGDNGLDEQQLRAATHLYDLMFELSNETPSSIKPADLVDDPRWVEIRTAASRFLVLLRPDLDS